MKKNCLVLLLCLLTLPIMAQVINIQSTPNNTWSQLCDQRGE